MTGLLLRPQEIMALTAAAVGHGLRVGVLCPTAAHIPQVTRQWADALGSPPVVRAANPYEGPGAMMQSAEQLKEEGVRLVALDCIAYTLAMQKAVQDIVGVPVILARRLAAVLLESLLG
jgi:protein AroM